MATKLVIDNFEGGYGHPKMLRDDLQLPANRGRWAYLSNTVDYGRINDVRYNTSGETMFGIDRERGGTINTTPVGKQFWSVMDQANAAATWKWGYIPPEPQKSQLLQLAAAVIEPGYKKNLKKYLNDPNAEAIINSDPRLVMHFVYASWNGPGWFLKFAKDFKEALARGVTDLDALAEITLRSRTDEGIKKGSKPNSLIAQGGNKMRKLYEKLKPQQQS